MVCKNCGSRLGDNAKVCPNCGAFVDDASGYTLLTADDRIDDYYTDDGKKKKSHAAVVFFAAVLVIVLASVGALYYMNYVLPAEAKRPDISFVSGSGIINGNERVLFTYIKDNKDIEYIQHVSVYSKAKDERSKSDAALYEDYEYTKSIDDTFRAIFVDAQSAGISESGTYYFDISLSFHGDSKIYAYETAVNFDKEVKEDVSNIVFDHSLELSYDPIDEFKGSSADAESTDEKETQTAPEKTTEKSDADEKPDFINEGFWYTQPENDGDIKRIYSIEFKGKGSATVTAYSKDGGEEWINKKSKATYKIKSGYILIENDALGEKRYKYNISAKTLTEENENGDSLGILTNRKYNSTVNAENFFEND